VDQHFPDAVKIVVVMDNLNTHTFAALYQAFEPAEARRIIEKLEIHYTPKHGSWLNMAEIELSVLQRQSLKARIPDRETLIAKTMA
jgi:transposase